MPFTEKSLGLYSLAKLCLDEKSCIRFDAETNNTVLESLRPALNSEWHPPDRGLRSGIVEEGSFENRFFEHQPNRKIAAILEGIHGHSVFCGDPLLAELIDTDFN